MSGKVKNASVVLQEDRVVFECPFCGMNLVKINYLNARKLLQEEGLPRGKVCDNCGGVAALRPDEKAKAAIEEKTRLIFT
ncbi:hypothetical protein ACFL2Q_01480 [Thermodesulfobacteriota bacterium]